MVGKPPQQRERQVNEDERKIRRKIAAEIRNAAPTYEQGWGVYVRHFLDAADVAEMGLAAWQAREDEADMM